MRDIAPDRAVIITGTHGRPKGRALRLHPDIGNFLGRKLGLATRFMHARLEIVERDLSDHRVQHVLDLAGKKTPSHGDVISAVDKLAEGQHLGEDRCCFGERQRCVGHQIAAVGGKPLVDAMAHFMGQGHHIAGFAGKIHQDIGMRRRCDGMRKGAGALAGARCRVDPVPGEKGRRQIRHRRVEPGEGLHHQLLRLLPGKMALVATGQRRVAIPPVECVLAHPACLQRIIAVRQIGIS